MATPPRCNRNQALQERFLASSNSLLLGEPHAEDAFAVAGNPIGRVGTNDVAAGTTGNRVAGTVAGEDRVVTGTAEQTVCADAADERVRAAEAVEDVAAAEPEQTIRPVRAAECVPAGSAGAFASSARPSRRSAEVTWAPPREVPPAE